MMERTKEFLRSMGIPWTMKERNTMSDKELTDTLLKLTKMKREEYEERRREYDTTGIWIDTMHEVLIEACNWIQIGINIQRERPWLNPNLKKANNMLFCTQKRQRKEK